MSFPRYPKYKDSGVAWLGEVPEHWEVRPNKAVMTLRKREVGSAWSETELLSLTLRGVMLRDIESGEGKYPSDFSTYQMVEPRDLVFCLFDMDETPRTVGVSPYGGMITAAYDVFRCNNDANAAFVYYFYMHIDAQKRLRPFYTGLRKTVRMPTFLSIKIPFPPEHEQRAIAAFLDRETAKIDALIAEQQRLIELLQEKRQAVISHAVTKGLNPDVPMKDSGIEWLGEVPEHWEVTPLKRLAAVRTGVAKGKDLTGLPTVTVPYLRVANVQDGYLELDEVAEIDILPHELDRYRLKYGDVLMNEGGDFDKLGRGHVWEGQLDPCITQNHVFAVRPESIDCWWLNSVTSSEYAQFYFMSQAKQSTNLASISSTNLMNLPVIVPPADELKILIAFIDKATTSFDKLVTEAEQAITLLQERRSALISAAVTGQIDIRGLAGSEAA